MSETAQKVDSLFDTVAEGIERGKDQNSAQTPLPNPGHFNKGPDSRRFVPGGPVSRFKAELSEICGQQTTKAVTFLIETMDDESKPIQVRMSACKEILDRGHGKPVSRDVLLTIDASAKAEAPVDVFEATEAQLNQLVSDALSAPKPIETVIEAELLESDREK
jgi:hypothetical protein